MTQNMAYLHLTILWTLTCILSLRLLLLSRVDAHGRMLSPTMRSSLWRFNDSFPVNNEDDFLSCGYVGKQYNNVNQGRCGECGDEWSLPRPRPNDEGGLYGSSNFIVASYKAGDVIPVTIELTVNHRGYFEFRLCPKNSAKEMVTQSCLDQNLLRLEDGTTRYKIENPSTGFYFPQVRLPQRVVCNNCVLQWIYRGADRPGDIQETYVNCADIAIF